MKRAAVLGLMLLAATMGLCQMPEGFHWVDMEHEPMTMATIRQALKGENCTAIREVGILGGDALIITANREKDEPLPDGDVLTIYSLNLTTKTKKILVTGFGIRFLAWKGKQDEDLTLTYYDCWECEPAGLFTALHHIPGRGWRARWPSKQENQPGAVIFIGDAGDPYTDDAVDQIFAVIDGNNNTYAAGSWYHARNLKSGKISDDVLRYSVNPVSGQDITQTLKGAEAEEWKKKLCQQSLSLSLPNQGQETAACKTILRKSTASVSSRK